MSALLQLADYLRNVRFGKKGNNKQPATWVIFKNVVKNKYLIGMRKRGGEESHKNL